MSQRRRGHDINFRIMRSKDQGWVVETGRFPGGLGRVVFGGPVLAPGRDCGGLPPSSHPGTEMIPTTTGEVCAVTVAQLGPIGIENIALIPVWRIQTVITEGLDP